MAKLVSVIIPYYDEPEEVLQYAVGSVAMQVGIDWPLIEVLLVNDGNPDCAVSKEFCERWPGVNILKIQQEENAGPGVTRQTGIDHALGEYVMFIDADDRWHNVAVLGCFIQKINETHADIIQAPWLEECRQDDTGPYVYVAHEPEATWMFAKAYRRQFLIAAGVRMHPELRVHEDTYFNRQAFDLASSREIVDVTAYLWHWRSDSTVRKNHGEYGFASTKTHMDAAIMPFEILRDGHGLDITHAVVDIVVYYYGVLQSEEWRQRPEERAENEKYLAERVAPDWSDAIKKINPGRLAEMQLNSVAAHRRDSVIEETLPQWCERIGLPWLNGKDEDCG